MENTDPRKKKEDIANVPDEEVTVPDRHYRHDDIESPHSLEELDNYDEHDNYTSFDEDDEQFDDD